MPKNFHFEQCSNNREKECRNNTKCDVNENRQFYQNCESTKSVKSEHRVQFITNGVDYGGAISKRENGRRDDCVDSNSCRRPAPDYNTCPATVGSVQSANKSRRDVDTRSASTMRYDHDRNRPSAEEIYKKCYPMRYKPRNVSCNKVLNWQTGKYTRDDCGSGIIPVRKDYASNRKLWCKTPLSTYQAMHGELGRKILCGELILSRRVNSDPPCNMCEIVQPLCRGYYRKYECEYSPCEKDYEIANGLMKPRTKIQRYWEPCSSADLTDVNTFAPHNMALARYLKNKLDSQIDETPCW